MNESSQNNLFINRHLGPSDGEIQSMLKSCGLSSLDELISETIPSSVLDIDSLQIKAVSNENMSFLRSYAPLLTKIKYSDLTSEWDIMAHTHHRSSCGTSLKAQVGILSTHHTKLKFLKDGLRLSLIFKL